MLKKILSTLIIGLNMSLVAQDSAYLQAEYDFANGSYEKAYANYKNAADQFQNQNNYTNYASCNLKMAECNLAMGKADLTIQLAARTLDYILDVIPDNLEDKAKALSILGEGYLNIGRNDLALESFNKEEKLHNDANTIAAAQCYNHLGVVYWNNGNKEIALSYHERSLKIKVELLDENDAALADSYNNIGLIYLEDEYLQSTIYFNKALRIYRKSYGEQHPKVANCYSNIAFANSNQNNYNEALQYLDLVMEIWEASIKRDHPNKAFTLSNRGRILQKKGDLDEALHYQQLALHQYLKIYGEKHPEVANAYFLIGSVYQEKEKYQQAAEHFQSSIYANCYDQNYASLYDLPELKNYYNGDILLSSMQSKGVALEAFHYEKSLKPRDLIGSLDTYVKCDELITQLRQLRLNEADKLRLGAISSEVYDNGIRIAVYLSSRTLKKDYYLNRAFDFCERSKSAILLEAIQETKAQSFSGIPDQLIILEDSLKTEISYLKQKLAQTKENNEEIKAELFKFEQAYRTYIDQLESDFPSYFKLKYNQKFATVSELQSALNGQSVILSYFTGEKTIYVFSISKKKFEVFEIEKESDFFQTAKGFRNSIKYNVFEVFKESSTKLYNQLIPKINNDISQLIVLPDGVLGTLPFEAFTVESNAESKEYNQLTYLLEQYSISYDYAATLILDRLSTTSSNTTSGILLAAPINFEKNELIMPNLPDSEKEINEIRYLFIGTDQKPTVAIGSNASESLVKADDLNSYKFIHFATHGVVNESKPELSRIFLCPEATEDGSLYSGEIYNLKINADLVTLSACETGLGKIAKGEGIVGLSRSLMYAGAQNLIVSLWQVADASTAQLMIEFYTQHLRHSDSDQFNLDLKKAKLSLLQSENYASPYYWAPFILVGD
jgi:CHAT domain-containing protein